MKTNLLITRWLGLPVILLSTMLMIMLITNCGKKETTQSTNNKIVLKDTVSSEQDLRSIFGSSILSHLQQKYDQTISRFSIDQYSELESNDSTLAYEFYITCSTLISKQIICVMGGRQQTKSTEAQGIITYSCTGTCTCAMTYTIGGSTVSCGCTQGPNKCTLNVTINSN